ncbi:MAG: ribonuclease III [Clostridia bacterium]|nr:ribonuclease III [Clostridia bacterium]
MADFSALQQAIGYRFTRQGLLKQALTHPSLGHNHNQRLEFLGDAVLELCVSEKIYENHPEMQEGAMTRLRQKLVREEKLAQIAREIRLGNALLMDKSCVVTGGRDNPSVLCDAFEAVLAAVYLDGGIEEARAMVARLIGDCTESGENDAKSALQEYLQGKGHPMPAYETVGEEGPPHERIFTSAVLVEGKEIARGQGTSKKRAEQEAARIALQMITRAGE